MGEASASELNPEPIQDLRAMRGQSVSRTLRTFRPILLLFKLGSPSSNLLKPGESKDSREFIIFRSSLPNSESIRHKTRR